MSCKAGVLMSHYTLIIYFTSPYIYVRQVCKFASWNIEGLSGKLDDSEFVSNLNKFDIVSLVETW